MYPRKDLITALTGYETAFAGERMFVQSFLQLLQHKRAFFRDHLPGHVTASAWITTPSREYVLLTHHAKLKRWLQPGGHADGDEDVLAVARREAREETGLTSLKLVGDFFFDIDIHPIPARGDVPEHLHYDVRFLFEASPEEPFTITEESIDLAWHAVSELGVVTGHNRSMLRMAEKATKRLWN